ncbi:hypothetical protein [Kitasatospora griseola]
MSVSFTSQWGTRRLKWSTSKIGSGKTPSGGAEGYADSGITFLRSQNIHFSGLKLEDVAYIDRATHRDMWSTRVLFGDVLLNITGASLGRATCTSSDLGEANVNQHVCIIRPTPGTNSRYMAYALGSQPVQEQIRELQVGGNRDGLNFEQVGNLELPAAPQNEQHRIANFLDTETTRIDRIYDLRARQQTLLEEAAIRRVYDAVRGTHLSAERKESGLDWLGTVPANWRIGAVSYYFEVELGKMLNQERAQGEHLRPYLRVANVQWDRIDVTNLAMMDFPPAEQARYRLKDGDLLVNEGGSWPGRAAVWSGEISEIYYQKALHRIREQGAEITRWLYYCLVAAERLRVFQVQGNTSTMTHLTREQLRSQRFPFPEVPTQARLVAELDRAASRDAEVQLLLSRQLTLLAERRQALITAAVTGQFDVSTASGRNVTEGVTA